MAIVIGICNTLNAFDAITIGTKVIDQAAFLKGLTAAIKEQSRETDRYPGQHAIILPDSLFGTVSAGVGKRTLNPNDYTLQTHREHVSAYLKRSHAAPIQNLTAIVYTKEAYLNDPDVQADKTEFSRTEQSQATHVLVALLSSPTKETPPLSPYRLVHNLAGGNNEATLWSAAEIYEKAKKSKIYWDTWATVADELQ